MQVILSDYAKTQIKLIYAYYKETASSPVAKKIIREIIVSIEVLKKFPQAGQVDDFMKKSGKEYRRIISGNYKIIYRITGNEIRITDIFDSRQDPEKQKP